MKAAFTTLSENTAGIATVQAEQGLSTLIKTGNATILFDAGQTTSVSHNADVLGIDLTTVDKIVLSHGHFDHTGGLRTVLQRMKKPVDIVCHPDAWAPKYDRRQGRTEKYIGIPFQRAVLESLGARFVLSKEPVKVAGGVMTSGEVPMVTPFESIDPHLFVKEDENLKPDEVRDDLSVIVNTGEGLVVVLGCAHRGMINTIYHAQKLTGVRDIHMVLGGSHLIGASEERIWMTVAALKDMNVGRIGLCHCTSLPAAAIMAQEFGDRFFFNNAGNRVEVGE